ncbi:MAG TPA: lysylphosphatidylglycerol synthase domain-containing protein [Candidatus Saccharimonadia bacterium]|nr:lysylphosphatidylglycerol synthase domain-containing protein [Candidatus Saccharimonadia bacterium]
MLITGATIILFTYYLTHHLSLVHQLLKTSPLTIVTLLVLFGLWFGALALILQACMRICNLEIPHRENLVLNAYSTFLNYFLPGQGGPVLRGIYLKGKYNLPFRRYLFASLVYYAFYAAVSMLLLIGGIRAWWQTLIGVLIVSACAYLGARYYARTHHLSRRGLNFSLENMAFLAFATCLQAICQVAIYWVELNSVDPGLKIGQVMSYTGAANFALFVNITPGAVGIRETFLIFSEKLHHITNAAIVGANVLDRSSYILFLAIIFCVLLVARGRSVFSFKSGSKLKVDDLMEPTPAKAPQFTKTY